MQEHPLVSIIIPTYNRAHLISETLDSVLAQTYTNWECLVVDDGSTDATEALLHGYMEKDSRFQYHKRPDRHLPGGNGARNYGFEVSKGEYVQWFDSDDMMHPKKLEIQIGLLLQSNQNFSVCQTEVFNIDLTISSGLRKKHIYSDNALDDFVQSKITFLTQSPIFRKQFLINYNLKFDETLLRAQEFEFFVRVLAITQDYCYTDIPLVLLRKHTNSISGNYTKPELIYSTFIASYNSYHLLKNRNVHSDTLKNLRKRMLKQINLSVKNEHLELTKKMVKKYLILVKSIRSIFYLMFGIFIYKLGKNGENILNKA